MPSIGKDLATIRSHLGLTIQDIQYSTKIPVSTLQTIENDSIFTKQDEGKTYIRSFVRSYGRALKIEDDIMIRALDQFETGNYNHLLLQGYRALAKKEEPEQSQLEPENHEKVELKESPGAAAKKDLFTKTENLEKPAQDKNEPLTSSEREIKPEVDSRKEELSKADNDGGKPPTILKPIEEPSLKNVDWANVGQKISHDKKKIPAWLISLIILAVIAAAGIYVLYASEVIGSGNTETEPISTTGNQAARGSLTLDLEDPTDINTEQQVVSTLDEILYITVYAAYERLDPVRVWSDLKPRLDPYWVEQGSALEFEFTDTVRIRGNYSNMILFKNGHLVHNFNNEFFNDEENALELTRSFFISDQKWATPISFELPEGVAEPDSVILRPSF